MKAADVTDAEFDRLRDDWLRMQRRVLPADWRTRETGENGARYDSRDGLRVIATTELVDGEVWFHVSFSRADRVPSWHDVKRVKDVFVGPDHKAVMVLPKESEYYNCHPFCLHLFVSLERDPLPDFRDEEGRL